MWEINFTIKYFLKSYLQAEVKKKELEMMLNGFSMLIDEIVSFDMCLTHRDYHSRNIMVKENDYILIDFQDSRLGIPQYDLVSLIEDCYYEIDFNNKELLKKYYYDKFIKNKRDQKTYTNVLSASYIFTNRMGLTLRMRHYWSKVDYNSFHILDNEGHLTASNYLGVDVDGESLHNTNFNAFSVDMAYRWVFAPGSELSLVFKSNLLSEKFGIFVFGREARRTRKIYDYCSGATRSTVVPTVMDMIGTVTEVRTSSSRTTVTSPVQMMKGVQIEGKLQIMLLVQKSTTLNPQQRFPA